MAKPMHKTNAMRILERENLAYQAYSYTPDGNVDGVHVAKTLGVDQNIVFKTLVTQGKSGAHYVFVIPVAAELHLKKAADFVGEKSIALIPVKSIQSVTGYIRGGCSPVGMKKLYPTVVDSAAKTLPTMLVSGGKIGLQLALSPDALVAACGAVFAEITSA